MRRLLIVAVALVLQSCANPQVPPSVTASIRSIAVVSLIAPRITLAAVGTTRLQNSVEYGDIGSWRLNADAEAAARSALSARYAIVPARIDPPSVAFRWSSDAMEDWVRAHLRVDQPVDAVLVIWPDGSAGLPDPRLAGATGIVLVKEHLIFRQVPAMACTLLGVTLLDGRTLKPVARWALEGAEGANRPLQHIDVAPWKDRWAELTPAQQSQVEATMRTLLAAAVSRTIDRMMAPR